jgi:hypothetical protein
VKFVYPITIASSSILLFSIQPVITKAILPAFGGSAGVWVTSMLFFQVALLAGYLYSYWLSRSFGHKTQSLIHVGLLLLSLGVLPVKPRVDWAGAQSPMLSILMVLLVSVGLPYFLLASTSPLLQSWFTASYNAQFPYRLFALSNAASVMALLAYPVIVEPLLPGTLQLSWWSVGYAVVVSVACLAAFLNSRLSAVDRENEESSVARRPILWVGLAACASALWLAVANHLSQEVAPVPFLWVLPFSIYLISFIICFADWYRSSWVRWLLPAAWAAGSYSIARPAAAGGLKWEIAGFSVALFIWCMFCHGELARTKPLRREDVTFFYLMVALGGALGGVFVAVVAPNLFRTYLELPIGIIASVLLALPLIYGVTSAKRIARLGVVALAAFVFATYLRNLYAGDVIQLRNFYGALQVTNTGTGEGAFRSLYNGRTLHGVEFLAADRSLLATTYYGPESGAGKALLAGRAGVRKVGVVGLGAGTLAAYGRTGDTFRFYEINPAVIQIASGDFHFLDRSAARTAVIADDGRLALRQEPSNSFDVIVLDAFSDDSIPVHLMTKEAFGIYFRLLRSGGVLAVHLTNRYLNLNPVVDGLAAAFQKRVIHVHSAANPEQQILAADWALVSDTGDVPATNLRLWTDDYSNLFQVLK